jgi:membrane protein implicated in regulation of membrane protease activity
MLESVGDTTPRSGKLTASERRNARLWQIAPWVELAALTVGPPAAFLLAYLLTGATSPAFLFLALASLPFSLIVAILIALTLILFRRRWTQKLRDRLASDGITADEVGYFLAELTGGERRALREMENRQPLLADAYRETLALRLNASRLTASARRDLLQVDRRINRARYLDAPDTAVLIEELGRDRTRLDGLKQEGASRRAEAEARLQMIEAAFSRGASWAETNYMLQRLDEGRKHMPLGLESFRAEQELREDVERELRKELKP